MWPAPMHSFKRGDELYWTPGPRRQKQYGTRPIGVIYLAGHINLGERSSVYIPLSGQEIRVTNNQLIKRLNYEPVKQGDNRNEYTTRV